MINMKPAQRELRELIRRKAKTLSELALHEQGEVPANLVSELSSLKQLADLNEAVEPPSIARRWTVPAMLVVTLIFASVLLFVRLPNARVDLDIATSHVAFDLEKSQDLASNVNVLSISASGLRSIDASGIDRTDSSQAPYSGEADSARLSIPANEQGTITLQNIHLPARTRVTLETLEGGNRFRIAWALPREEAPTPLSFSLLGAVQLGLGTSRPDVYHLGAVPKGLDLVPGRDVVLELEASRNSELQIEPQLPVSMLSFVNVQQTQGVESSVRPLSMIRSGVVSIQSLNGQNYKLRPGERLRFSSSEGEMQKTVLGPRGINVQYEGKVWGMSAGSSEFPTSLMPSMLEWLRARHGLSLLWGSALYAAGMLTVALRWFRLID